MLVAGSSFFGYAQFTPGNLVVVQANTGAGTYPSISLKEFTRTGVAKASVNIAYSDVNSTVLRIGTSGGSTEGFLNLSPDYSTLSLVGYNALPSATSDVYGSTYPKMFLKVVANGTVTYTKNVTGAPNSVYIRAFALDGTDGWITSSGSTGRIRYIDFSATSPATSNMTSAYSGNSVKIFNGKLYFTAGSAVYLLANPKSGGTSTAGTEIVNPADGDAMDFVFFDTDGDNENDLLYIGTDGQGTANLYKYKFDTGTSTWVAKGSLTAPATLTGWNKKVNGLTGYRNTDGKYVIYYSTFTNIFSFVDDAAPSAALSISPDPLTPEIPGEPTIIATAPANTIFRGLSFTPGSTPTVLPVTLKSFSGKAEGETIRLNWSTASEKNNSHFEVLRSVSDTPSEVIGTEMGNGDSNSVSNYSFVDANPSAGTNYYQLKQVDKDGKSVKSNVVAVKSNVKATTLSVSSGTSGEILVHIHAENNALGNIYVSDILGHKLTAIKVSLEKGYNNIPINTLDIKPGIYIVTLNSEGKNLSVKFVK